MIRVVYDMPERVYHADPCEVPSLTQSIAHTIVCESPAKAYLKHPKLGNAPRKVTEDMETGTAFHALLLGKGSDIVPIDAPSFKGDHAKEMAAIAREAGKVPMLASKYVVLAKAAEVARQKIEAAGYFFDGQSEVSVFWEETATDGTVVQCRARWDHLCASQARILDLKKVSDAHPDVLPRHMTEFGYDIQEVSYRRALRAVFPELAGRDDFVFLFCELAPPYAMTPLRSAGSMQALGELKWTKAVDRWAQCLQTGVWPDYATETVRAEAPAFELNRWLGAA
jgi:hypothetical protein